MGKDKGKTIKGSSIGSSGENENIAPKCKKLLKAVQKKKIKLENIGDPTYNNFLELVRCQMKANKNNMLNDGKISCVTQSKQYEACHASIMGTGSFDGRKHCADELEALFRCVL